MRLVRHVGQDDKCTRELVVLAIKWKTCGNARLYREKEKDSGACRL